MKAIILAGGFGSRLKDVISDVPKPMAPIVEKPFLALLIEYLKTNGVNEVVLSVHHLKDSIQDFFGDNYLGVSVKYAIEEEPLGTGGGILNAIQQIYTDEPVFVFNGDTFLKIDLKRMHKQHKDKKALLTIALKEMKDCKRYGQVVVDGNIITDFAHAGSGDGYINAGVYVLGKNLFEKFRTNRKFSFERDFLYQHVPEIKPQAFFTNDYFIDIGIPEDYKRACDELPSIIAGEKHV